VGANLEIKRSSLGLCVTVTYLKLEVGGSDADVFHLALVRQPHKPHVQAVSLATGTCRQRVGVMANIARPSFVIYDHYHLISKMCVFDSADDLLNITTITGILYVISVSHVRRHECRSVRPMAGSGLVALRPMITTLLGIWTGPMPFITKRINAD